MKIVQVGKEIAFDPVDLTPPESRTAQETAAQPKKPEQKKKSSATLWTAILVALFLSAVFAAAYFYVAKEEQLAQRMKVEADLKETQATKARVELKLEELERIRLDLEERVLMNKANYESAVKLLQDQQKEVDALKQTVEEQVLKITDLRSSLDNERAATKSTSDKVAKLTSEQRSLKEQLDQLRMAKEALENRVIQLSRRAQGRGVELDTIVVGQADAGTGDMSAEKKNLPLMPGTGNAIETAALSRMEGQVLVVNREFAFVVVNIGQKDGIKETTILNVYRGTALIGQVQVERVYDTMSSAVILADQTKVDLQEGDIVRAR
ncbi:MAG: hypothetical protein NC924_07400 [Candidatus Omnitrophica bacterium]|nr:hypothetical protein [Candidatus Omnitrophota bacterium]